jgi:hypothetical protein
MSNPKSSLAISLAIFSTAHQTIDLGKSFHLKKNHSSSLFDKSVFDISR